MNRLPKWYEKLTPNEVEELNGFLVDKEMAYKEVAELYGVSPSEISRYAAHVGIPKRSDGAPKKRLSPTPERPATLSVVEREIAEERARVEAGKKRLAELEAKRAALQVRLEWDDNTVLVHGVVPDMALRATAAEWISWLNNEGPRKLREFVAARRA